MYRFIPFILVFSLSPMENTVLKIKDGALHKKTSQSNVSLYHTPEGFMVEKDNAVSLVEKAWLPSELRNVTTDQVEKFQEVGYFRLHESEDGKYSVSAHARGVGGGPILAMVFYWGTKAVCYGGAAAAASGVVAATGGGVLAATGGVALGAATGGMSAAATGVSIGIGTAAAGGVTTGLTAATVGTTAVIGTAGSVAGAITFVESAAVFMGSVGAAIPFI